MALLHSINYVLLLLWIRSRRGLRGSRITRRLRIGARLTVPELAISRQIARSQVGRSQSTQHVMRAPWMLSRLKRCLREAPIYLCYLCLLTETFVKIPISRCGRGDGLCPKMVAWRAKKCLWVCPADYMSCQALNKSCCLFSHIRNVGTASKYRGLNFAVLWIGLTGCSLPRKHRFGSVIWS